MDLARVAHCSRDVCLDDGRCRFGDLWNEPKQYLLGDIAHALSSRTHTHLFPSISCLLCFEVTCLSVTVALIVLGIIVWFCRLKGLFI